MLIRVIILVQPSVLMAIQRFIGSFGYGVSGTGAAYVFTRDGDTWAFQAKLTAETAVGVSDQAPGDWFGAVVSVHGNHGINWCLW